MSKTELKNKEKNKVFTARPRLSHPLVFVVLKHANTVFDDKEQIDAGQRRQPFPHSIKSCHQISVMARRVLAVIVLPLRL